MATQADIQALVDQVDRIWSNPPARNGAFGNVLRAIGIKGIRGLDATVEFTWPATAIAGTNGSGKTTFLQVASAAYVGKSGGRQVKLGSWIRGALQGDTPPIRADASILYDFADTTPSFSVDYVAQRTRWGYPRRGNPVRNVQFIGITEFAPRVEKKDRVHHARGNLQVLNTVKADTLALQSVSRILGTAYSDLTEHEVGVEGRWNDQIPQLARGNSSYSEPHMGAGEQKVVRLVNSIERVPPRSLILLEEPELTLHPDAQVGLAWYLIAVARRRGHQILVATHSEHLFQALPTAARVMLVRTEAGTEVLHHVNTLRAARELTRSLRTNAPLILVEDETASSFLAELLRQTDRTLLRECAVVAVGNDDDVRRLTASMRAAGIHAVGVRDGDRGESPLDLMFSLPGGGCPESVLVDAENVGQADCSTLAGAQEALLRASPLGRGHPPAERDKRVLQQMAIELDMSVAELSARLAQTWLLAHRDAALALTARITRALESG